MPLSHLYKFCLILLVFFTVSLQANEIQIVHAQSELCLTPLRAPENTQRRTALIFSPCKNDDTQVFRLLENGDIQHHLSKRCVVPRGRLQNLRSDSPIVLSPNCDSRRSGFRYTNRKALRNQHTRLCISHAGRSVKEGDRVQLVRQCRRQKSHYELNPVDLSIDTDNDGVDDEIDLCPQTPAGTVVDDAGCPVLPALSVVSPIASFANNRISTEFTLNIEQIEFNRPVEEGTTIDLTSIDGATSLKDGPGETVTFVTSSSVTERAFLQISIISPAGEELLTSEVQLFSFDQSDDTDNDGVSSSADLCPASPNDLVNEVGCEDNTNPLTLIGQSEILTDGRLITVELSNLRFNRPLDENAELALDQVNSGGLFLFRVSETAFIAEVSRIPSEIFVRVIEGNASSQAIAVTLQDLNLVDGDLDGILDSFDQCPDTMPNRSVDKTGCSTDDLLDLTLTEPANAYAINRFNNEFSLALSDIPLNRIPEPGTIIDLARDFSSVTLASEPGESIRIETSSIVTNRAFTSIILISPSGRQSSPLQLQLLPLDDAPTRDTDNDGINDKDDVCINTPTGTSVNEFGCVASTRPLTLISQSNIRIDSVSTVSLRDLQFDRSLLPGAELLLDDPLNSIALFEIAGITPTSFSIFDVGSDTTLYVRIIEGDEISESFPVMLTNSFN